MTVKYPGWSGSNNSVAALESKAKAWLWEGTLSLRSSAAALQYSG
jgi:hypothetical protein